MQVKNVELEGLPDDVLKKLKQFEPEAVMYQLELNYEHFSTDHILTKVLPEGCEVPSAFETIGHIAHVNLREPLMEYKHVIGQVILDKNPALRTVVNKTSNIATKFRTFPMEVIAGDDDMEVQVKESVLINLERSITKSHIVWIDL